MGMQKYRADRRQTQPDGAVLWSARWAGGDSLARIDNCRWDNLAGDVRVTVHITGECDTFFSQPAICSYKGRRVVGYVTCDDGLLVFRHSYY